LCGEPEGLDTWSPPIWHDRVLLSTNRPSFTQAARRFAGVPDEALAEFPSAGIERVREGKFWFAGT
jgi:hypothetical protein